MNEKLFAQLDRLSKMDGIDAAYAAAQVISHKASELAPRDTGYLAEHIYAEKTSKGAEVISLAPYTEPVEFGTVYMEAQPFLRPAMDEYQADINKAVREAADSEVKRRL